MATLNETKRDTKNMTYTPMNAHVMSFVMYDSEVQDVIENLIVTLVLDGHDDAASKVAWVYGMSAEQCKSIKKNFFSDHLIDGKD